MSVLESPDESSHMDQIDTTSATRSTAAIHESLATGGKGRNPASCKRQVIAHRPHKDLRHHYHFGMKKILNFPQLTPDPRLWRIDWFGEVGYPGAIRRYAQPCLKVSISPLLEPAEVSSVIVHTALDEQQSIWMPVGSLPMLRIGDVWQNGKLALQPEYEKAVFPNMDIGPRLSLFIKAGLSIGESYLLPFNEHPWHRQHTHSYCVAVKVSDSVTLVIPGAELIRFYFGSCSILLHRLITRPFREGQLIREKHFDHERKHLHLKLADGIPCFAVSDLGRIATDEEARRAAASIYEHCVKATAQGELPYPYMGFPFRGKTTLVASGMWLSFAGEANRTFLAFRLSSCSHRFVFDSLTYDPCLKASWRKFNGSTGESADDAQGPVFLTATKARSTLDEEDPGAKKSTHHLPFADAMRFPDLRHKSIRLREIVAGKGKQLLIRHQDGSLEPVAFGEPESGGNVGAVDLCADSQPDRIALVGEKLPKFVRDGVLKIRQERGDMRGGVFNLLCPVGEPQPVFSLPMVVDEDGVVDQLFLYREPDGRDRLRRGCFIELLSDDRIVLQALIIEARQIGAIPLIIESAQVELAAAASKLLSCPQGDGGEVSNH